MLIMHKPGQPDGQIDTSLFVCLDLDNPPAYFRDTPYLISFWFYILIQSLKK